MEGGSRNLEKMFLPTSVELNPTAYGATLTRATGKGRSRYDLMTWDEGKKGRGDEGRLASDGLILLRRAVAGKVACND